MSSVSRFFLLLIAACALALPASAAPAPAPDDAAEAKAYGDDDPFSGYNHAMFEFNRVVDGLLLKPAAQIYRGIVPEEGRTGVSNALANLYSPVTLGNSILQGDVTNSFATLWRFLINSTVGIGGLFDVASEIPLKNRTTDFGQTLAIYGAEPGNYVVLPIIGPSNVRDAFGRLADMFMQPWVYIDGGLSLAIYTATAVDARATNMKLIDDIYASSVDPYTTFKSGFTQKRAADVRRARIERQKSLDKIGFQ